MAKKSLKDSDYRDHIKQFTHISNIQELLVEKSGWLGAEILARTKTGTATEIVFVSGNKEKAQALLNLLNNVLRFIAVE